MYTSYFGFSEKPFEVTPDPKYFYASPSHQEMLASLVYGIRERRGFIVLTGEVGTGKTMLINAALDRLDENTKVAYIGNTALTFEQLLLATLEDLGILEPGKYVSKMEAIRLLNEFTLARLSEGGNVVLIVDEAQNLDEDCMENLRLLSNLETRKHKLIQIALVGQPELDVKLGRPELRQLAQRVSVRRIVKPLTEDETYAYMWHRLEVAGYGDSDLFSFRARKLIHEYSGGIPRKINILCDNALLIGFALKKRRIDPDCVAEAAGDLKWVPIPRESEPPSPSVMVDSPEIAHRGSRSRIAVLGILALAVGLGTAAGVILGRTGFPFSLTTPPSSRSSVLAGLNHPRSNEGESRPAPSSSLLAEQDQTQRLNSEGTGNIKSVTSSGFGANKNPGRRKPPVSSLESIEKRMASHAATPAQMDGLSPMQTISTGRAEARSARTVIAERDDSLSKIIYRVYGRYHDSLLILVLNENPEIQEPDSISVGQVIRLPDLEAR